MSILSPNFVDTPINLVIGSQFIFDSFNASWPSTVTHYSWITPDGSAVYAIGTGIFLDGNNNPVAGTITSFSVDIDNDGVISTPGGQGVTPDYSVNGFSADLVTMISSYQGFIDEVYAGDDTIQASDANDTLKGGSGADSIDAGDGDDIFLDFYDPSSTLSGDDTIEMGLGNDSVSSNGGNDSIILAVGGADVVEIDGDNGVRSVTVTGLDNNDWIDFSPTDSDLTITGTNTNVTASSVAGLSMNFAGAERIIAGNGNDNVIRGGIDYVDLGAGDDTVYGGVGGYFDIADGGVGIDTIRLAVTNTQYNFDLDTGTVNGVVGEMVNFENYVGNDSTSLGSRETVTAWSGGSFIDGRSEEDVLIGGIGSDTLYGGHGADSISGGLGDDYIFDFSSDLSSGLFTLLGDFDDTLVAGAGNDEIYSYDGNDSIDLTGGGMNLVVIDGDGVGTTTITALDGDDTVSFAPTAADVFVNAFGEATTTLGMFVELFTTTASLETGMGNDTVIQAGYDEIFLNEGDDRFEGIVVPGTYSVDGGAGNDTYKDFSTLGRDINFATGTVNGVTGVLTNFENFAGNTQGGNDTVTAVDTGSVLNGAAGSDSLIGGLAADTLLGGNGTDDVAGNSGDDSITGGNGSDTLRGNVGEDTLLGQSSADQLFGGQNNDLLLGGAGSDVVDGGDGNDDVNGGSGDDTVRGGAGNDTVSGVAGSDSIEGGSGDDNILGGNGFDTIDGGTGSDTIDGGLGQDMIDGGGANDSILGGAGGDTVSGDGGNDTVHGQGGNDLVLGESGSDLLYGDGGNDTLYGGIGFDTLEGGLGADVFVFDDSNNGADVVVDFLVNVDDLELSQVTSITTFADFTAAATDVGADLVISLGGSQQITLLGVQESQVDANDIIFV